MLSRSSVPARMRHHATVAAIASANGVAWRPNVDSVSAASTTNGFTSVLLRLLDDAREQGLQPPAAPPLSATTRDELVQVRAATGVTVAEPQLLAGMTAWMSLFGSISFILFGQLDNVIGDRDAFFGDVLELLGHHVFVG